jgi:hypothetical protein
MRTKLPAATSNRAVLLRTRTACVSVTLLRNVLEDRMISKGIWPPRSPDLTPPDYYPWGNNEIHCLQRQSSHCPWTEGIHRKFYQNHPSDWIDACFCKQDKTCRYASTNTCEGEAFPASVVTLVSTWGVFVLTYRDSLNVLIVYGRFKVTSARAVELVQNLNTENVLKMQILFCCQFEIH